jgi:hypothetical protein
MAALWWLDYINPREFMTRHSLCPFVDHFHQSELEARLKAFHDYFVQILYPSHAITDGTNNIASLFQFRRQDRFYIRLLLENKTGKQSDDFLWFIVRECIFQNQFCKNKLVGRIDLNNVQQWIVAGESNSLTSHATLPFKRTVEFSSINFRSRRTSIRCS